MGVEAIIAEVQDVMEGVTGIENVYEYDRWAASWGKVLDLFKTAAGTKYQGWMITRIQTATRQVTLGEVEAAHVLRISGLYGLDDSAASEVTFQAWLDALVEEFLDTANIDLGGACLTINPDWGPMAGAVGLQIDKVDTRMFGTVLCHFAECRLGVVELVNE